jgi:hypothetical protein
MIAFVNVIGCGICAFFAPGGGGGGKNLNGFSSSLADIRVRKLKKVARV